MSKSNSCFAAMSFAVALLASEAAHAEAAALILAYEGNPAAQLDAYSELPAGTTVSLPGGSRITLLHYRSCKTLTVTGGTIRVQAEDVQVQGAKATVEVSDQCPQQVRVRVSGVGGGVLLRSVSEAILPPNLSCTVVGARGGQVETMTLRDDRIGTETPAVVRGHSVSLPAGHPFLESGHDYTLVLKVKGANTPEVVPVSTADQATSRPCLIRVD